MIYHYTYITTNLINGKQYIGDHSTSKLDDNYLGSGLLIKEEQKILGKENFKKEILEFFSTKQEAYNDQEKYIKLYKTHVSQGGYNKNWTGGQWASIVSDKTRKKISRSLKEAYKNNPELRKIVAENSKQFVGEKNGMYGKKQDPEKMKQRWIDFDHPWIGRHHKKESKQKISQAKKGKLHTEETKQKMKISNGREKNGMYGKTHSSETKEKMKQKAGREWTNEQKQKVSIKNKGKKYSGEEYKKRYVKIPCEYCRKLVDKANYKRWHGEKCKYKKINL